MFCHHRISNRAEWYWQRDGSHRLDQGTDSRASQGYDMQVI